VAYAHACWLTTCMLVPSPLGSNKTYLSKTEAWCVVQLCKPSAQQASAPVRYTPALELEV
jgi:hypothetical protein